MGALDQGAGALEYTVTSANSTTTEMNVATAAAGTDEHKGRNRD